MNPITITNENILLFYKENPSIDIVNINLVFIDILKQLSSNLSTTIGNTLTSQIYTIVSDIKTDVQKLRSSITIQLHDIKKEYIDDMKVLFLNTEHNNQEKINKNIENMITKINDTIFIKINEIIPRNQELLYKQIEQCIKSHCDSIGNTTNQILQSSKENKNNTENDKLLENMEKSVSAIIQSLQQSVFAFIQKTDINTQTSIQQIHDKISIQKQVQDTLHTELSLFLNKYKTNSSVKGAISEIELYHMLQKIVPSDEIIRCSSESNTCDIKLNRKNTAFPTILFESKDYINSVNSDEIAKFERDLQIQKCHGIFVSQNSPITFKEVFHIDIIKGLIHLYIPNANYDVDKLKLAIHVIDNLSERISVFNTEDTLKCSQEDIEALKEEYMKFALKKNEMIESIRTVTKHLVDKMEEIQLPVFKKITGNNENTGTGILCTTCNHFWAKNKASLSAHMKKCKNT